MCFPLGGFFVLVLAAITQPFQVVIPGIVFAAHDDVLILRHSNTDAVVPFHLHAPSITP